MKRVFSLFVIVCLLVMSCENDKKEQENPLTIGAVTFSNAKPTPGDSLTINYEKADETEAFFAYMVGSMNYNIDVDFPENQKASRIKIPDSADAIVFIPKNGDNYDHNDKQGYFLPMYNEDGNKQPGTESAMALFSVRYGERYGIKMEEEAAVSKMASELEKYPELKEDWEANYLYTLYQSDPKNNKVLVEKFLDSLGSKTAATEDDYQSMQNFYYTLGQEEKSDSIKKIAIEKFPDGKAAANVLYDEFFSVKDLEKRKAILEKYNQYKGKNERFSNYMNQIIANSYFKQGDMENFYKHSAMINDKDARASSYNNIAWDLAERGENLDNAATISKKSVELIESLRNNPVDKPDYYSQRQYERNLDYSYRMYADTYALILFKQGKIKEAIDYQEKAQDPEGWDVEANARFISYLMADEQYKKVNEKAEKFIANGNGNQEIIDAYRTAYNKINPDTSDFDEKLKILEKTAHDNYVAEIKEKLIDEEAPQFSLKNLDGEDVSLASLKGKTVVLDFWATWCGPCIASFPGMQEVVTKYKDKDDIEILFIDTFESGENREQEVTDFIKKNNYTFNVVYDETIEGTGKFEVASAYEVTGIPTKAIIGPDGKMKFKSVGYSGSTEKLIKEMDIIIEILQQENS